MSDKAPTLLVVLTHEDDPARVAVDLTAFLRFSDEVTFGLEDVVERWESTAAPRFTNRSRTRHAATNNDVTV